MTYQASKIQGMIDSFLYISLMMKAIKNTVVETGSLFRVDSFNLVHHFMKKESTL